MNRLCRLFCCSLSSFMGFMCSLSKIICRIFDLLCHSIR